MRRVLFILTLLLVQLQGWAMHPVDTIHTDTLPSAPLAVGDVGAEERDWKEQIKHLRITLDDTITQYPKFIKTALKVGRWVRNTLYTYDTTYVEGFDNKWRFTLKCNNWFDAYSGRLTSNKMPVVMSSYVTTKFGAHISYKGFGLGYMLNLKDVFTGKRIKNRRWDGSINTSRVAVEWYYTKDVSNVDLHRLGDFGKNKWQSYEFQGLERESYGAYVYYFFNHPHYCQSAAYGISRLQLRSSGSFILGLHAHHQDINMDFNYMDDNMLNYLPDTIRAYRFSYRDYCVLVGYGYSWVPHRRWLINFTAIPSIGLRHAFPTSIEGDKYLLSTNIRFKIALVLNRDKWSYGFNFVSDGHWYRSSRNSFFNSSQDINFAVCFRI